MKKEIINFEHIGKAIQFFRKKKKLTQKELAEKINKAPYTIKRYEKKGKIPLEVLNDIALKLEVSIEQLLNTNPIIKYNDFKYESLVNLIISLGYTYEVIEKPLNYINNLDYYDFEPIYIIKNEKTELQLSINELELFFDDIEEYINLAINKESKKSLNLVNELKESNLDSYLNDEKYINILKEKKGLYGDKKMEELTPFEKIVWEKWKENNKVTDKEK